MPDQASQNEKVRQLLNSEAVTPVTAKVLLKRLQPRTAAPRFFTPADFNLLSKVCDLLMDQTAEDRLVDVASFIDERLAAGKSEGWRFDHMPPGPAMYLRGLQGTDETAYSMFGEVFIRLTSIQQTAVLKALQTGTATGMIWQHMSAATFFAELLAEATEIFYAHPFAQQEIGYTGMADAFGWHQIGLNEQEKLKHKEI